MRVENSGKHDISIDICSDVGSAVISSLIISVQAGHVLKLSGRGELGSKVGIWLGWAKERLSGIIDVTRGKEHISIAM